MSKTKGKFMNSCEVATLLGVTSQTIRNWVKNGILKPFKSNDNAMLFSRRYVENFVKEFEDIAEGEKRVSHYRSLLRLEVADLKDLSREVEEQLRFCNLQTINRYVALVEACMERLIDVGEVKLNEKERFILGSLLRRESLSQIGEKMEMCSEGVRQIEKRVLRKIARVAKGQDKYSQLEFEYALLLEDNRRLKEALDAKNSNGVILTKDYSSREALFDRKITDVGFSVRATNCLRSLGIISVGDLDLISETTLNRCRNVGKKTVEEIKLKMKEFELKLKP